jgi:hypothetical protein
MMGVPGTTEGVWATTGASEGGEFEIRTDEMYICGCVFDTEPFCGVPAYSEARANAHLIAASPDMYDALAEVVEFFGDDDDDDWACIAHARAALAKARGQ